MIAIVFIDIRRNYYVRISITELRRKLGIADPGICSDLCRLLVYFYQTTEKRAEKSSGHDLRNGSGRYGVIIDISDDDIIVEFGSNRNCRIPMQKAAVAQVEKAAAE